MKNDLNIKSGLLKLKVLDSLCRGWYRLEDGKEYVWDHYDNIFGCLIRISDGKEIGITLIDYDDDDEPLAFYYLEYDGGNQWIRIEESD